MIDPQRPAGNQELVVNLNRSEASFLIHLARATNLDIGEVCERLIALAGRPDADWRQDVLFSDPVQSALKVLNRERADNHWTQVNFQLDQNSLDLLDSLAERASSSRSRTLRHLIADCMEKSGVRRRRSRHRRSGSRRRRQRSLKPPALIGAAVAIALIIVVLVLALHDANPTQSGPYWAGNKAGLILDPHTHTRYSDGKLTPDELVAMAVNEGCDALVITDHSHTSGTVSARQLDEMNKLRERYPDLLLFNGVELNMPSYGQREHATLMASPSVKGSTLRQFRDLAEHGPMGADTDSPDSRADIPLLQRIAEHQALFDDLLVFYNHPARKDPDIRENFEDMRKWNAQGRIFLALEGAPGHQNAKVIGSYKAPLFTQDRWDPVVAEVGGVWDQLLSHGHDVWGALASSDYHNDNLDKPPCAFSRTHLAVPERSYRGVLAALKTGTFWADHGRILDQLWFSVHVEGLEGIAAYPGSTVSLTGREEQALLALSIERGPGSLGKPLVAEFIGSCQLGAAESLAQLRIPPAENSVTATMSLVQAGRDGESCTVRARVRLEREGDTDYLAYSNHIRLILD
jgi:hypothetical protein